MNKLCGKQSSCKIELLCLTLITEIHIIKFLKVNLLWQITALEGRKVLSVRSLTV